MAKALNPNAAVFTPAAHSFFPADGHLAAAFDPAFEESVTSEELEELEAAEEWVELQAELDDLEREHLIATALAEADPAAILEVEMRTHALDLGERGKPKRGHQQPRKDKQ